MKTLILSLALLTSSAYPADLATVQAIDAQIAHLKAQRAAAVKTLDPLSRAELRVLQAHEGLAKARERAGKAPKAPKQGNTHPEVLL